MNYDFNFNFVFNWVKAQFTWPNVCQNRPISLNPHPPTCLTQHQPSPKPYGLRSDSSPVTMTALASHPRPAPSSHTQPPRHLCRDLLCQSNPLFRSSNCPLAPNQRLTQTDTPKAEAFCYLRKRGTNEKGLVLFGVFSVDSKTKISSKENSLSN